GPAFGQHFLHELPDRTAGQVVVGADVAEALAVRRVVVLRDQRDAGGNLVQVAALPLRINDADGDGLDVLDHQVVNDLFLQGRVVAGGPAKDDLDAGLRFRLAAAGLRDGPEGGGVVADEGHADLAP